MLPQPATAWLGWLLDCIYSFAYQTVPLKANNSFASMNLSELLLYVQSELISGIVLTMDSANTSDLEIRHSKLKLRYRLYFGCSVMLMLICLVSLGLIIVASLNHIVHEHPPPQPNNNTARAGCFDSWLPTQAKRKGRADIVQRRSCISSPEHISSGG